MRFEEGARAFALRQAEEIITEARRVGIVRSLDATRASQWLLEMANAIREACGEPAVNLRGDLAPKEAR